jgi:predicted phage tail protein
VYADVIVTIATCQLDYNRRVFFALFIVFVIFAIGFAAISALLFIAVVFAAVASLGALAILAGVVSAIARSFSTQQPQGTPRSSDVYVPNYQARSH